MQGQLQEGLRDKILESPTVVGSLNYTILCLAAKNKERRLRELARRHHHRTSGSSKRSMTPPPRQTSSLAKETGRSKPRDSKTGAPSECYNCYHCRHLKCDCPYPSPARAESKGKSTQAKSSTRSVSTVNEDPAEEENPLDFLHSDSDDQTCRIQIEDQAAVSSVLLLLCRVFPARA